jgi:hypothetical protein
MNTPEWEALRAFRQHVYCNFGCRRDALVDLLDALLTVPTIETPAHVSLAPTYQRGWGSIYDALRAGTMDLRRLEALVGVVFAGWRAGMVRGGRQCVAALRRRNQPGRG